MAQSSTAARTWASGGVVLAATLMLIVGLYQIFMGIAAIAKGSFFVVGLNYAYTVNVGTWGWIHLAIGVIATLTGFALFTGTLWARIAGIALLGISAVANFFFLPYYPLWSLLIIAVDIFAIWAVARSGSDAAMVGGSEAYAGTGVDSDYGQPQTGERWPATNATAGRHWAGEPAKEGVARAPVEQESSEAMAQRGMGRDPGQPGGTDPQQPMR